MNLNNIGWLNGTKIVVAPNVKVRKESLSQNVMVSDTFRNKIDDWLETVFGFNWVNCIPDGEIYQTSDGLYMNQKTADILKNRWC
jgi:hypothetical protein